MLIKKVCSALGRFFTKRRYKNHQVLFLFLKRRSHNAALRCYLNSSVKVAQCEKVFAASNSISSFIKKSASRLEQFHFGTLCFAVFRVARNYLLIVFDLLQFQ